MAPISSSSAWYYVRCCWNTWAKAGMTAGKRKLLAVIGYSVRP
jgi:hypothetical protein